MRTYEIVIMDTNIIASWGKNTAPWVQAVREGEIASRTLVTNRAIVDTVRSLAPASGIDQCPTKRSLRAAWTWPSISRHR